jgi:hypothetical protein
MTAMYLPYEFTSVPIGTGNTNPFGIDPEQTTLVTAGNTNPFDVDPEQTTLVTAGNTNPFDVDPEQTVPFSWNTILPAFLLESQGSLLLESGPGLGLERGSAFAVDPELTVLITTDNTNLFGIDPEQTTLITTGLD